MSPNARSPPTLHALNLYFHPTRVYIFTVSGEDDIYNIHSCSKFVCVSNNRCLPTTPYTLEPYFNPTSKYFQCLGKMTSITYIAAQNVTENVPKPSVYPLLCIL